MKNHLKRAAEAKAAAPRPGWPDGRTAGLLLHLLLVCTEEIDGSGGGGGSETKRQLPFGPSLRAQGAAKNEHGLIPASAKALSRLRMSKFISNRLFEKFSVSASLRLAGTVWTKGAEMEVLRCSFLELTAYEFTQLSMFT